MRNFVWCPRLRPDEYLKMIIESIKSEPDFYLTFGEYRGHTTIHSCWILKRVISENRKDCVYVKIDPGLPFPSCPTVTGNFQELIIANRYGGLQELIIASRHKGRHVPFKKNNILEFIKKLFGRYPIFVYVMKIKNQNDVIKESYEKDELELICWGELHISKKTASKWIYKEI